MQSLHPDTVKNSFLQAMNLAVPILRVVRLTKGYSTECWRIDLIESSFLMKIALRDQDTQTFARLITSVNLALQAGVTTPRIISETLGHTVSGRSLLIQEWLTGIDSEEVLPRSSQAFRNTFFYRLGATLGSLHAGTLGTYFCDVEGANMYSDIKTYLQTMLVKIIRETINIQLLDSDKIRLLEDTVSCHIQALAEPVTPCLAHLDLHLPNLLILENEQLGLLDFEHARFTDPVEDFIKLHVWVFRQYPEQEAALLAGYSTHMLWCAEAYARLKIHLAIYLFSALIYFVHYEPEYIPTWSGYIRHVLEKDWKISL